MFKAAQLQLQTLGPQLAQCPFKQAFISLIGLVLLGKVLVWTHAHNHLPLPLMPLAPWWQVVFLGPLFEEIMFRGLIQPRLQVLTGPIGGLLLTSVLFAAWHTNYWVSPLTLVFMATLGLACGRLVNPQQPLAGVIAALLLHISYNAIAILGV